MADLSFRRVGGFTVAYRVRLKNVYRTIVVLRGYNVWKEKSSRRERNATSSVATNADANLKEVGTPLRL